MSMSSLFNDPRLQALLERDTLDCRTTAHPDALKQARDVLPTTLPTSGLGEQATSDILYQTIAPALAPGHAGPRYFGFVTGGRTPISQLADIVTTSYDNNVQVHLPNETISTYIESIALDLVLNLLSIPPSHFQGRTISTGATTSNILGLALGRQFCISQIRGEGYSVAENGFRGIEVEVLSVGAHASIRKAAAVTGIGRGNVREMGSKDEVGNYMGFDMEELEKALKEAREGRKGVIVCPSYGEVNTGAFTPDMPQIRELCDQYGAWIHLDAAFGGFAALHPDFGEEITQGMMFADSLTLDGHKWLNVPYDCGLFYTRTSSLLQDVCGPGGVTPAYLSTSDFSIPSPLNVGLENSRRFRALPLYCSLLSCGKEGYAEIVQRNINFARRLENWLYKLGKYDVLTPLSKTCDEARGSYKILNIVLFAPSASCGKEEYSNPASGGMKLCEKLKERGVVYTTPTVWKGRSAIRLAVSNWQTGTREEDYEKVIKELEDVINA